MSYRKAEIRPPRPQEEQELFALAKGVFGDRSAWEDRTTLDVLVSDTVFVAEVDGSRAGFVALTAEADRVRIDQLCISPVHEHEGIGRQLIDFAEGFAISRGARALQVVVEEDNSVALGFYRRRGFATVETELLELVLPQT